MAPATITIGNVEVLASDLLAFLAKDETILHLNPSQLAALTSLLSLFKTIEPDAVTAAEGKGINIIADFKLVNDIQAAIPTFEADLLALGIKL